MTAQPDKVIQPEKPVLPIRQEVGLILKRVIPPNGWKRVFHEVAIQGFISDKVRDEILVLLCQRIEKMEDAKRS